MYDAFDRLYKYSYRILELEYLKLKKEIEGKFKNNRINKGEKIERKRRVLRK